MSSRIVVPTLTGPSAIQAAEARREQAEQKTQWPYAWTFPPPGAVRVTAGADTNGTLIVPAAGTPTLGLAYTVPQGFQFALERIVAMFITGGSQGGWDPGACLWTIDVNRPTGITSMQGYSLQGFTAVDIPLGTLQFPWPLECPEIFEPNDTIRMKYTNVTLSAGAGNFLKTLFLGWRWPVS